LVDLFSRLHLILWEEGAKGLEGKSKLAKDKSLRIKPRDASPRDEKAIKGFSARNKSVRNNKTRPSQRIGVLIEPTY
jgi:hypothetical protein